MNKEESIDELFKQLNEIEVQSIIKLCPMLNMEQLNRIGSAVLRELKKKKKLKWLEQK